MRAGLESKLQKEVHSQKWQGKFLSAREEDEDLNFEGCFWWLSRWQNCPTHTVAGMFELYEQLLPTNRVDALIIDHQTKRVITLEMSCPWITNRTKKTAEKTLKNGPLRWELKQQYQGYEVRQYNIIMDVLGGWSRDLDVTMKELVGSRSKRVLQNMQKAVLSGSLNIARTFKVAT